MKESRKSGKNRLGLMMIAASFLVITLIALVLFRYLQAERESSVRNQGSTFIRTLSSIPLGELLPGQNSPGVLQTVFDSQTNRDFAYAAISGLGNQPLVEAAAPGFTVPPMPAESQRDGWLAERELTDARGRQIIEFYTPLYEGGAAKGILRTGYLKPGFGLSMAEIPFLATLALFVFLLTPAFYLIVGREIRPLAEANVRISEALNDGLSKKIEVSATGELGGFMDRFNQFVGFAQNRILELEQQQEKLQTSKKLISYSKARVENVLEAIPEAVLILDQTGKISYANRKVENLLGVPFERVTQEAPEQWCTDEELLNFFAHYSHDGAKKFLEDTVRISPTQMSDRALALKAYPLFAPSDTSSIYGTLVVLRDVTKEALAQRAQGEFVSHVAHELKTPLNTLALYSESLLGEHANDPAFRIEAANVINDEVERLSGLIGNLLAITRIEQGDMTLDRQRVRIGELLADALLSVSRDEKASQLTVTSDLPNDITNFSGDKDLIRIAVNNLLTNAIKYSDPGDSISLRLEETPETIRIHVTDTGIGIASEEQNLVSQRFYRSESDQVRQRVGHGLGLSLVADIVHLHGGTLDVQSSLGEGSTFTIVLPKESASLRQAV